MLVHVFSLDEVAILQAQYTETAKNRIASLLQTTLPQTHYDKIILCACYNFSKHKF